MVHMRNILPLNPLCLNYFEFLDYLIDTCECTRYSTGLHHIGWNKCILKAEIFIRILYIYNMHILLFSSCCISDPYLICNDDWLHRSTHPLRSHLAPYNLLHVCQSRNIFYKYNLMSIRIL